MDAATRALVRERADNRCEYCLLRQEYCEFTHCLTLRRQLPQERDPVARVHLQHP